MSMSIEELDKTVRTFYEGRGDVVSIQTCFISARSYGRADVVSSVAKASAADDESGIHYHLQAHAV